MQDVTPEEVEEKIKNGAQVIDVRTKEEFSVGHIGGSMNINVSGPSFTEEILKLPKDSEYVVYCQSGGRSSTAQKIMAGLGFKNVYNLAGGIGTWKREKISTEK